MDIRKFSVEQTARFILLDAKDNPMVADDGKQMAVILYSPASKQYAKAQAERQNRLLEKLRNKDKAETTAEQNAKETADFLSDCTHSFENVEYDKLQGRDMFFALYSDASIGFIADQVNKYLGDWGNFTKG